MIEGTTRAGGGAGEGSTTMGRFVVQGALPLRSHAKPGILRPRAAAFKHQWLQQTVQLVHRHAHVL